ncbi:MAG: TonB family protein [Hyphomicrobium sp.]
MDEDLPDQLQLEGGGQAIMAPQEQDRGFWLALVCAVALHAALIIEFQKSVPRRVGDASGRPDAISVELVRAADLDRRADGTSQAAAAPGAEATNPPPPPPAPATPAPPNPTPPAPESAPPAPPTPEPPPPEPKAAEPELQKPVTPQPEQSPEAAETAAPAAPPEAPAPPESPKPAPKPEEAHEAAKPPEPALPTNLTDWPLEIQKSPKPQATKPAPKNPPSKTARLDLNPKLPAPGERITAEGRSAAVSRPAGITQSGWNDDFGRGVIRGLRQTLPAHTGIFGRVTVRIVVSEAGNLAEVAVTNSSGIPYLDQNVVFSVKQASFPFPPKGATLLDRIFNVTYVYR